MRQLRCLTRTRSPGHAFMICIGHPTGRVQELRNQRGSGASPAHGANGMPHKGGATHKGGARHVPGTCLAPPWHRRITAACAGPINQITVASALRILHAIHDFLPRPQAGSEIYALELGPVQSTRHHVTILCADYDPSRRHGHVTWRAHAGLPIVEIANNWICASFADTYRSARIG